MKLKLEIFIFSVFSLQVLNGLTFIIEPNVSYIEAGLSFNLTCLTDANATWMFNGVSISPVLNTSSYLVDKALVNNTGSYSCTDGNSSATINITVQEPLPKPVLSLNNTSVWSGLNIFAICNVSGPSDKILFKFFKNNITVDPNNTNSNILNLFNLQSGDSGNYSCAASINGIETFSDPVNLIVQLLVNVQNQVYQEGDDATMTCATASSEKILTYSWFFEDRLLNSNNATNSNYTIKNVSRTNAGDYVCQLTTVGGVKNGTGTLYVQYQDTPLFINLNLNPFEDTPVTFNCTTNANVNLTYQILKNNSVVSNTSHYVINSIQRNDSGQYSCKSYWDQKEKTVFINVNVLYQDTPSFINLKENPFEGTSVTFNCTTNANVHLAYQILKDNHVVANTSYYVINSIIRNDSGQYSCTSTNQTSKSIVKNVTVWYPPNALYFSSNISDVFNSNMSDVVYFFISQNFSVQCCTTDLGVPNSQLNWFSEGNTHLTTTLLDKCILLSIVQIARNSSGRYTCYANSSSYNVSKSFNLTVQEVPDSPIILESITTFMSIWLKWSKPEFPGSNPIINYKVSYQINGSTILPYKVHVNDTMFNITGLNAYVVYRIDINTVNIIGESESATIYIQTNETAPSAPRNLIITNNNTQSLFLFWNSPEPTNGNIINYRLCYYLQVFDGVPVTNQTQDCKDLGIVYNYTICCLENYSSYSIQLTAQNYYLGVPFITSALTQEAEPTRVNNVLLTGFERSVHVVWSKPDHIYGVLKVYMVMFRKVGDADFKLTCDPIYILNCQISNLTPNTNYEIQIGVHNQIKSNYSVHFVQTLPSAPPPFNGTLPVVLNSDITKNSFKIQLVPFSDDYGSIRNYKIIVIKLLSSSLPTTNPSSYSDADISSNKDGLYLAGNVTRGVTYYVVGSGVTKRRKKSLAPQNPALDSGTYYTVFIRAYVTDDKYQSTGYYTPVQTQTNKNTITGGIIAAIVVPIACTVVLVILVVSYICFRRKHEHIIANEITSVKKPINLTSPIGIDNYEPVALKNFEDHVNRLKANSNFLFSQEYGMINRDLAYSYSCSRLQENNIKNRYHNIPAYDTTRVVLHIIDNEPTSDYINANYVEGFESDYEYIATQGPLPETVFDFWRMVWETETMTIVMLTRLEEKGRVKCAQYWPESGCMSVKDIVITITEINEFADHVIRTFHVTRTGQAVERLVKQFHFTAWPDFGVPNDPSTLLSFIRKVNKWKENSIVQRAIVHCSAGVGRTGTYITIDTQIKQLKKKQEISIYANVSRIREQRCLLVQTEDQYIFIHNVLLDYIDSGETEIEASELRDYYKKSQMSESGMTELMLEFIRLAKSEKKDQFVAANRSINQEKNRFKNIYPYDDTRVKLFPKPGVEGSDYINANYVDSYSCKDFFIATQAPLESTIGDFWRMVWEQKVGAIVMISKEKEGGQIKVHPYWPTKISLKVEYFIIELSTETTFGDYIVREFKLTNTEAGKSFDLKHFQFTTWPEIGSPDSGIGLIELIGQVQRWNALGNNKCTVVHCSAGVGRTGVFIALTNLIERVKVEALVDVFQTVKKLRYQRTAMVQTKDQYEFCYKALQEYLDSFDLYANFR